MTDPAPARETSPTFRVLTRDLAAARQDNERLASVVTALAAERDALLQQHGQLLDALRNELAHAALNAHRLDRDCQGVPPGGEVPAVRAESIDAVIDRFWPAS